MTDPASASHRVLALTGATGFIGTTLLTRLSAGGWHVRALYRPRPSRVLPRLPHVEWVPGDVHDDAALAALVAGVQAVVHCAGAVRGASRVAFDRINEQGTRHVVRAAAHAPGCRRLLLLSSLAARAPELSDYAASKWRGEQALRANAAGLAWSVLRPPAVYGPGDRELLPLFRGIARGIAVLPAGARGRFSLIYVDDVASAVLRWLAADAGHGQTFELDDGRVGGYDWDAVLEIAGRVLRGPARVRRVPVPVPLLKFVAGLNLAGSRLAHRAPMLTPGKVREITHPDWLCDSSRFARTTGWRPAFDLERGLACTFGKSAVVTHGIS